MCTGVFPYSMSNVLIENVQKILEGPEPSLPNNGIFSPELQDFVSKCLKKNHKHRSNVKELYVNFKHKLVPSMDYKKFKPDWISNGMDYFLK